MKFKMAATAGLSLTLDPMGKMLLLWNHLDSWNQTAQEWSLEGPLCGSHLGITINIKNTNFVKDLPMIDAQFRFNQCNSFREEYISVFSPYGSVLILWPVVVVLYKLYVFCSDMKFKMAATAGLSLTLDPMGKMLLLWNHLDSWNQTAQEWSLEGPLFFMPIGVLQW
jgi:hypothetical protein